MKKTDQASKSNTTSHGNRFDVSLEYENNLKDNMVKEKVRTELKNIGTSSFDDLFNGGNRAYNSEGVSKGGAAKL